MNILYINPYNSYFIITFVFFCRITCLAIISLYNIFQKNQEKKEKTEKTENIVLKKKGFPYLTVYVLTIVIAGFVFYDTRQGNANSK